MQYTQSGGNHHRHISRNQEQSYGQQMTASKPSAFSAGPGRKRERERATSTFQAALDRDREQTQDSRSKKVTYKVYNSLEMKGLRQRLRELEAKIEANPTEANQLALLRAQLMEMGSCYQYTKNEFKHLQRKLEESQAAQKRLKEENQLKDALMAALQKECDEERANAREVESDKAWYRRHYHDSEKRLRKAKDVIRDLEDDNFMRANEDYYEYQAKAEALNALLDQEKEAHAMTLKKFEEAQAKHAVTLANLEKLEQLYKGAHEAQISINGSLKEEQQVNEGLQKQLLARQQEIDGLKASLSVLESKATEFHSTIQRQKTLISEMETNLEKYNTASFLAQIE